MRRVNPYGVQGNILINSQRQACLADFGIATALQDSHTGTATGDAFAGTVRWMAAELLRLDGQGPMTDYPTLKTDIWAVGMIIWGVRKTQSGASWILAKYYAAFF
jgi:serine/threonine protein kinase